MTPDNTPHPADEPTPEEIAAAGTIRPLDDLPSTSTIIGHPKIAEPTLAALSPEDQRTVLERARSSDPSAVQGALMEFLRERRREALIRGGAGEGATASEREALDQLNQTRILTEEYHRLERELEEVLHHSTEIGEDGKPVAVPVYVHQGDARSGRQHRMAEIKHEMALIAGVQGQAAMERAAKVDALKNREIRQQLEDHREIGRRAHEIAREERIDQAARQRAKFLKPTSV